MPSASPTLGHLTRPPSVLPRVIRQPTQKSSKEVQRLTKRVQNMLHECFVAGSLLGFLTALWCLLLLDKGLVQSLKRIYTDPGAAAYSLSSGSASAARKWPIGSVAKPPGGQHISNGACERLRCLCLSVCLCSCTHTRTHVDCTKEKVQRLCSPRHTRTVPEQMTAGVCGGVGGAGRSSPSSRWHPKRPAGLL